MTLLVLLDTGPLGLVVHPKGGEDARRCKVWLQGLLEAGTRVVVPAISDYELRRELLRTLIGTSDSIGRLDALVSTLGYLPINRETFEEAARFWAKARDAGRPTAPDAALDGDCILAAQAILAPTLMEFTEAQRIAGIKTVIATTNVKHLERYAPAQLWSEIGAEGAAGPA